MHFIVSDRRGAVLVVLVLEVRISSSWRAPGNHGAVFGAPEYASRTVEDSSRQASQQVTESESCSRL